MYFIEMYIHLHRPPLYRLNLAGTRYIYEGWNFNSGNYLFTTDTK